MAATAEKAHVSDKSEKKSKKDKKDKKESKKEKLNDDGVKKSKKSKDKKEKKDKAAKLADAVARELDIAQPAAKKAAHDENSGSDSEGEDQDDENVATTEILAPFALPLANKKQHETLYDMVKRSAQLGMIARGVKECKKLIKKSPSKSEYKNGEFNQKIVVLIAGDVSPMEVIMALPLLCEEHNILYFFVKSRAKLGLAAATKRSTSIVALKTEAKKTASTEDVADLKKTEKKYLADFGKLVGLAEDEFKKQVLPFIEGTHPSQLNYGAAGAPVATD